MATRKPIDTYRSWGLCLLLVVACGGCFSSPRGVVRGRVTHEGQPVTPGTIIFENSAAGVSLMADLDSNGRYELGSYQGQGLPAGKYLVAIKPKVNPADYPSGPPLASEKDLEFKEPEYPLIPKQFRSITTSNLSAEVQKGNNPPFDFDLGPRAP